MTFAECPVEVFRSILESLAITRGFFPGRLSKLNTSQGWWYHLPPESNIFLLPENNGRRCIVHSPVFTTNTGKLWCCHGKLFCGVL